MSEGREERRSQVERDSLRENPRESSERENQVKLLAGRIVCVVGVLLAVGGTVAAILSGGANISAGAVGAALGILGYFLGTNRLGTATIIVSVAALFLVLAASQGLIPGVETFDRKLPDREPRAPED